jgi:polynucleotide 5'-hydroxyl-kinase GRC3/NOL9
LSATSVVVLGDVDTGKSGFTLYAANLLVGEGKRAAIVDTDIGQSDIGPPGTIGMAILDRQYPSYPDVPLTDAYFVGDKTPTGHLLPMVVGAREMADRALSLGADVVLVNTTGMVHGGVAAALKFYKIEALKPALIVALQRSSEIEHLLKPHEGRFGIVRLRTPDHVARRGRGERAEFRSLRMGHYLAGSKTHTLELARVTLLNTSMGYGESDSAISSALRHLTGKTPSLVTKDGRSVTVVFDIRLHPSAISRIVAALRGQFDYVRVVCTPRLKGLLVGLYDHDHKFLCGGTLDELKFSAGKLRIRAPIDDPSSVRYVYLGYLMLDEGGNEVGSIRPGEL